jgi:hypothetical protein
MPLLNTCAAVGALATAIRTAPLMSDIHDVARRLAIRGGVCGVLTRVMPIKWHTTP